MTTKLKAFTLIELLIVIVIIGILAVALIPRLTGAQATSRDTARKATLQQAATIITAYVSQEGGNAVAITANAAATAIDATMVGILSGYGNMPMVGPNNTPLYIASGGNGVYVLSTELEKGNGNFTGLASANGSSTVVLTNSTVKSLNGYGIRVQ